MLLQFNVTNFLSFKNEVILDLTANSDKSHEESLLLIKKDRILPCVAVYGTNAAGKSNLNKALTAAIMLVRESSNLQINQPLSRIVPFMLDDESRNNQTRFDFIYTYKGTKFEYGFVLDQKNVYEEYLYEYKSVKPSLIFERSSIDQYKFTAKTKGQLSKLTGKNTSNKLFLSTATSWNSSFTKDAYMWFAEAIDTYDSYNLENMMYEQLEMSQLNHDSSMNEFMLKMLQNADLNISDFSYEVTKEELNQFPIKFDENPMVASKGILKKHKIDTMHKVDINGVKKEYALDYNEESNGTQRLFTYGPLLKNALEKGKTIVVDEIDNGLHPILIQSLIEMFQNPTINKNGAQLIFNTHEISLLNLNLFRRDQIYFVEKDNKTAASDLYSLDEFSPRNSENVQKGYLQGRYGAIPAVSLGDIEW